MYVQSLLRGVPENIHESVGMEGERVESWSFGRRMPRDRRHCTNSAVVRDNNNRPTVGYPT